MKKAQFMFTAILALGALSFSNSNAQTVEENHKKLAEHHTAVLKKSGELSTGTATDKKKTTTEIGTNIEGAKKQHGELETKQTEKDKTVSKVHHDAIKKHHANATKHHMALKTEVEKPNPDPAKVKEHSTNVNNEMKKTEKHHTEIKKKTGK
jgi:hypothetical protein